MTTDQLELTFGRAPASGIVHVVLPNMSLACNPDFLAKPPGDRVLFGASKPEQWATVTCVWCRCQGRAYLHRIARQMQGHAA